MRTVKRISIDWAKQGTPGVPLMRKGWRGSFVKRPAAARVGGQFSPRVGVDAAKRAPQARGRTRTVLVRAMPVRDACGVFPTRISMRVTSECE